MAATQQNNNKASSDKVPILEPDTMIAVVASPVFDNAEIESYEEKSEDSDGIIATFAYDETRLRERDIGKCGRILGLLFFIVGYFFFNVFFRGLIRDGEDGPLLLLASLLGFLVLVIVSCTCCEGYFRSCLAPLTPKRAMKPHTTATEYSIIHTMERTGICGLFGGGELLHVCFCASFTFTVDWTCLSYLCHFVSSGTIEISFTDITHVTIVGDPNNGLAKVLIFCSSDVIPFRFRNTFCGICYCLMLTGLKEPHLFKTFVDSKLHPSNTTEMGDGFV
jgi:hypothetical protein